MQQGSGGPGMSGAQGGTGMAPNVAGALSYVLGLITGIIFVLLEKDSFVRFHAFQSIVFNVAWIALWIAFTIFSAIVGFIPAVGGILALIIGFIVSLGLGLGGFVLWIVLIIKAYQGQRWKLPYLGDMAERYAGSQTA